MAACHYLKFISPPPSSSPHFIPPIYRLCSSLPSPPPPPPPPPTLTYHQAHNLLNNCHTINDLHKSHTLLLKHNLLQNESLIIQLLKHCFTLHSPQHALNIFSTLQTSTLSLQNLIIRGLSNFNLHNQLLNIYSKCQHLRCSSDNYTFPFVIKACALIRAVRTGQEIHCVVLRKGYAQNLVVQTSLVDFYAKTGHVELSRILFDEISQPDLVSRNALLAGYSFNGLDHEAFEVFNGIQRAGYVPNVSTFASLIPVCTRLGDVGVGGSVHGLTIKCGVFMDELLVPAFLSMYGSNRELWVAREIFDLLDTKNVVACNAMIFAYTQNGVPDEAFRVYCDMVKENVQPNLITFVSLVPYLGRFEYGEPVHACGFKYGLAHQPAVVAALLSMYAKLGDIESSQFLFDGMTERDLLSWNSMISAYVQNGLPYRGLTAFYDMQIAGMIPDAVSLVTVISACARLRESLMGMSLHAYGLRNGFDSNLNVCNTLLAFYCECHKVSTSINLFRRMKTRNVVTWNTLISSCIHQCDMSTVVDLLHEMQQKDVKFDLVTIISILPSFHEPEDLLHGTSVHGLSVKVGFDSDVSVINALISMYINCGDLDAGRLLFSGMRVRSVVSWNTLLTGYRNSDLFEEALSLFRHMIMEDQKPNFVSLLNILPACYNLLHGKSIHAYAVRRREIFEMPLITSFIFMYARFEDVNSSSLLFKRADKTNVTVWNAMLSAHVQRKKPEHTVSIFNEMLQMKNEPDYVTILTLISASAQVNSLNLSESVMAFVIQKGFEDLVICNSLVDLYARCGQIQIARKLFDDLKVKDVVSWSVMINGYGIHGNAEASLALFSEMKRSGLAPDGITFISILSACSHAGFVQEAQLIFNSMVEEHGISPRMEHYACMVDLLGRTGHLNEAYELVQRLPFKPSSSLLESLLGACSVHGNFGLAEEITRLLLDMGEKSSGSYVTLSNAYAGSGRWSDASRVRSDMEENASRKVSGFSVIEVNNH